MKLELSNDEQMLKKLYQENEEVFAVPFYDDELRKWPCWKSLDSLAQYSFDNHGIHEFFNKMIADNPQYNVWVSLHPRYFPQVLHALNYTKIICVTQGVCTLHINGTDYQLTQGDFCFIAPRTIHSIGVFSDNDLVINLFLKRSMLTDCFSSLLKRNDVLSQFFYKTLFSRTLAPAIIIHSDNDQKVLDIPWQIHDEYIDRCEDYSGQIMEAYVMLLLGTLLKNHEQHISVINVDKRTEDPALVDCIRFLYTHYATTSLNEMASLFHYSNSHLCKIIQQYTGKSFLEFTREKKLADAQLMLTQSDLAIKDIAEKCGFVNLNHFYRVFKDQFGITPLECRKQVKNIS